ncbi:bifunctional 4-hydroxy-2-oxoglutarate aldolase/2-dehydro-3-deoxy-phosphogluconate aldolase [Herbiconiux sp.]|uniref:bifunctional 4-hydroxy-2-oxoglutarate aldolase/2-dehydro-3-deoxy-phosphogluconate aldolase n=1 Tax=Herbiconiux sp. TaxID=1871186 RepID=UPI0025B99CEF|nr:bifunctional 4-hydroxy-2-oxoglutarate aldolase/2-dehydro-3-deoxy-phosphogluconate aldolase [Herbiconiux sp.]
MSAVIDRASSSTTEFLRQAGVVPVVVVASADEGVRLAEALAEGGLPGMEVTFRSPAAAEAIRAVRAALPDFVVGAGTLLSPADVVAAAEAGAHFGVAPGTTPDVVAHAHRHGLDFIPGAATASEVERALGLGAAVVKLFPAEVLGGVALLDAFAGPYPHARFMPTGGIRVDDLPRYLERGNVLACGGTWIAPRALLDSGDFAEISRRAASAADAVRTIREPSGKEHPHGA